MPRQKIYLRRPSANQPCDQIDEANSVQGPSPMTATQQHRELKRPQHRSYVNFCDFVRQNLQTSKDHLERNTPKEITPNLPDSTYQYDYVKRTQQLKDIPRVKNHFFEQLKQDGRIDMISVQKHDYKGSYTPRSQQVQQKRPQSSATQFQGKSTYSTTFINWKTNDQTDLIPSNHPTVLKDMPFMGRSLYKDCFKGLQSPPAQSFKASGIFRSPLNPPNMPTVKESTTMIDYRPFKTGTKSLNISQSQNSLMSPSYAGQYKTNYQKDFTNKIEEEQQMMEQYEQI